MEKGKFALNESCFLVKGAKRGAVYDLGSGDVYSVDEVAKKILDGCEKGLSLERIAQSIPELGFEETSKYLVQLESLKLGKFLNKEDKINKISLKEPRPDLLWLELTSACNLKCIHCYNDSNSSEIPYRKKEITLEDWKRVLKEAFDIGWRKVQFTGGEPFLEKETLFNLIREAKAIGYKETVIFSNGILLTEEIIQRLAKLNVEMSVSFYDKNPEIHDRITRKKESFSRTLANLKSLKRARVLTKISITVTKLNEENLFNTIDFLKNETGIEEIQYDLVRPTGRGCNLEVFPNKLKRQRGRSIFPKVTFEKFCSRIYGHNCFSKFLCITDLGQVIPCIMARDLVLGNIFEESIHSILRKTKTKTIQELNKDKIEVCKDCEYRYACFDCRPMAKYYGGGNLYAKPHECEYDPYLGIWENRKEVIK